MVSFSRGLRGISPASLCPQNSVSRACTMEAVGPKRRVAEESLSKQSKTAWISRVRLEPELDLAVPLRAIARTGVLACAAWRKLIAQPETITSIGMRDWAHVGQPL